MSIRLFIKEAQKLFTQKKFCLFAIGLLCIQALYLGSSIITSKEDQVAYHKDYQAIYEQVLAHEVSEREGFMLTTIEQLSGFRDLQFQQMDPTNPIVDIEMLQAYEEHQKACTIPIQVEVNLWNTAYTSYQAVQSYPVYIENIKVRSEEMKLSPMWKHYSEQKQQEILQTYERYAPLASMQPTWSDTTSSEVLIEYDALNWFIIMFVLLLGIQLFYVDEQGEMNHLMLAYPNGRKQTMVAKLLVGSSLIMLFTLSALLLDVWVVSELLGGIDFNSMMQSIPMFRESPNVLSIKALFGVIYVLKSFVFIMILVLFLGMYQMLKNRNIAILSITLLLVGGYVLYQSISAQSAFVYLRYFNIYTWMQAWFLFTSYVPISLLFIQSNLLTLCVVGIITLIILGVSINLIFYQQVFHLKKRKPSKLVLRMKDKLFATTSLYFHEAYHCFFMKKTWIIGVFILSFFTYQMVDIAKSWNMTRFYNTEINALYTYRGGLLNENKIAWLEEQNRNYLSEEVKHQENLEQYQRGEISIEVYRSYLRRYYTEQNEQLHAQQLYEQYSQNPANPYLINPLPYKNIFAFVSDQNELMIVALLMAFIMFMLSGTFANDQEHQEHHLYELCQQGRRKRYAIKVGYGIALALVCTVVMFVTRWLLYAPFGFGEIGGIPILDILTNTDTPKGFIDHAWLASSTLSEYTMLVICIQSIGVFTMAMVTLCISKLCRHRIYAILITCIVFFLPFLFYLAGYPFVEYITIFDLISGTIFLKDVAIFLKLIGCIILDVVLVYWLYQQSGETTTIIK